MRLAVLGAGMLGTCLSLELAGRGIEVDLYDREKRCVTQAGGRNEGKIHLGFVYGADPTFKTADRMLEGALQFYPLLRRWVGETIDAISVSSPFLYAIERGSILSVNTCEDHFLRLDQKMEEHREADYPGGLSSRVEKLSSSKLSALFDTDRILAAYRTPERSIDVRKLGSILHRRVEKEARISFFPESEIEEVAILGDQVEISFAAMGERKRELYDCVVNTLWEGRLPLDEQVGLLDDAPWSYRIKHAIFLHSAAPEPIPSVTLIQGPYGDLVNLGEGNYYLSWYPICQRGFAKNVIHPPKWNRNLSRKEAEEMTFDSLRSLSSYIPSLAQINRENSKDISVLGGFIYAQGETDVQDPKSGLHNRYELTIKSKGGYYSVNPGKYSLCPYFAYQVANQICSANALSTAAL